VDPWENQTAACDHSPFAEDGDIDVGAEGLFEIIESGDFVAEQ
jgi:hypothetical protein